MYRVQHYDISVSAGLLYKVQLVLRTVFFLSLQQRHWRDDFDLILTDRDVSMHSIIISQKPLTDDDAVHRNVSIRQYKIKIIPPVSLL